MACWLMGNDQIFCSSANTFSRMRGWMGCCPYGFVGEFKCRLLSLWKVPINSFKQSSFSALKNSLSIYSNNHISALISPCVNPFKQPLSALKKSFFFQFPQTSSLRTQKLLAPIPLNNLSLLSKLFFFFRFPQTTSFCSKKLHAPIPSNYLSPLSKTLFFFDPLKQPFSCSQNSFSWSLQTTPLTLSKLFLSIPSNNPSHALKTLFLNPKRQPPSSIKLSPFKTTTFFLCKTLSLSKTVVSSLCKTLSFQNGSLLPL